MGGGQGSMDNIITIIINFIYELIMSLPTFEDVCLLDQHTLHFIPSKSQHAFARALPSILISVILENTEEVWLKLFMLPKCILPSL